MSSLSIGLSGLQVNQQLLNITGQNITNANTPGYANEVANLAELLDGTKGAGVQITGVTRNVNQALQEAVNTNTSASNNASTQLDGLNQLQSYLATGTGTLHDSLVNLFTQLETLSSQPSDPTQRQVVVTAANAVTTQLNGTVSNINQLSSSLAQQANTSVASINTLTSQIAQLNQQIYSTTVSGGDANQFLDQRDQAVSSLAALIDVHTQSQSNGVINVLADGVPLVQGSAANTLSAGNDAQGNLTINAAGSTQPIAVSGGSLAAILTLNNTTLPAVQSQLNTFAQGLATQFDQIQATGLGLSGPMTSLTSQRSVSSTTVPLADASLAYPPQAGTLAITVTNLATGAQTLHQLTIAPQTESLADIASAISALPNMQAVVNAQAGTLNISAQPGYGFAFTGGLSTSPDAQAITGTTTASIDGQYTGTKNDTLTYTFVGSGTIGAGNLALQVTDGAGDVLGSLNVGQGYTPGTDLDGPLGVNVNLAAGTANNSDSFSVNVTGNPDSANLLPALGLDSFFVGSNAGDLQVNPDLLNNSAILATSTTGEPGDSSNLNKLVALQNQPVMANQSQTITQYLENLIGSVGTQTSAVQSNSTALTTLGQQLNTQLQNSIGVDQNEALTQLVQYQQSYQMCAQFVSVVNQTVTELINILQPIA